MKQPLLLTETADKFDVLCTVAGGGMTGQAGAIRLGIARALCSFDLELRGAAQEGRAPHARRPRQGTQEVRYGWRPQAVPVQQAVDVMDGGRLTPLAMKDLLEAGVHFGHQTKRWNPKMKPFIFGERCGIYILDLGKTVKLFKEAEDFVRQLAAEGKTVLFVGTKRQAQDVIAEEAARCGMYYVNERWLGGLLTNFTTIQRSIARLRDLEAMATDGRYEFMPKKEIARAEKEKRKLQKNLDGIRNMARLPDALFVVDTRKEKIAVDEARKLKIPVDRHRRHQLRSRRGRLRDSRQRRRAALDQAVRRARGRRRCSTAGPSANRAAPSRPQAEAEAAGRRRGQPRGAPGGHPPPAARRGADARRCRRRRAPSLDRVPAASRSRPAFSCTAQLRCELRAGPSASARWRRSWQSRQKR